MNHFIIYSTIGDNLEGNILGMSRMPWPRPSVHGNVRTKPTLRVTSWTTKVSWSPYWPAWMVMQQTRLEEHESLEMIYFGRGITKAQFDSYVEMELFPVLPYNWLEHTIKAYLNPEGEVL